MKLLWLLCLMIFCVGAATAAAQLSRKEQAAEQSRRKTGIATRLRQSGHTKRIEEEEKEEEEAAAAAEQADKYDDDDDDDDDDSSSNPVIKFKCPEANGYFPDPEQCDKYHDCQDGKPHPKLCPDGLVFNDFSPDQEKCDLPFGIDCTSKPKLQTPIPSLNCPRLHGYFAHKESGVCDKFYYCVDGQYNMLTCPGGLVFSEKTGICNWPDEAQKKGCGSRELFNFTCPLVDDSIAATHPRYVDAEDCQYFYVCVNGVTPRRSGCKLGQAFDERTGKCDWARKIPECKDWYKDQLTDEQLDALENPPEKPKQSGGGSSRRKSHRPQKN